MMVTTCLLGLLLGAAPPAVMPGLTQGRVVTSPLEGFFDAPALGDHWALRDAANNAWLSSRERWEPAKFAPEQTAAWNEMAADHFPRFQRGWQEQRDWNHLWIGELGALWGVPMRDTSRFNVMELFCWGIGDAAAFGPLLRASLQIRTSDATPEEKGRQIARLVKPWMTWAQVHALFGESETVFYDPCCDGCVVYVDYGVSVELGQQGLLEARSLCEGPEPYFHPLTCHQWRNWIQTGPPVGIALWF